jgi:pseudouridine kinase
VPVRGGAVVVIGGALVDIRAEPDARWEPGPSLPGRVRLLPGGAGRNVAANLARLGHAVTLLSAVGADALARWLLEVTAAAGVDVSLVERRGTSGAFVAAGPPGGLLWRVCDARTVEGLGPDDVRRWEAVVRSAAAVVCDANLLEPAQEVAAAVAAGGRRVLLATSLDKAGRLRRVLAGASLLVCNEQEAAALSSEPEGAGWRAQARALRAAGTERVVVTRGASGLGVAGPDGEAERGAADAPVVDTTGAGDAVAAAAVHALIAGWPVQRTADFAVAASAVVVQSADNTPQALARLRER